MSTSDKKQEKDGTEMMEERPSNQSNPSNQKTPDGMSGTRYWLAMQDEPEVTESQWYQEAVNSVLKRMREQDTTTNTTP